MHKSKRILVPYEQARDHIIDGDILLYSSHGVVATGIEVAGLSTYSHVAMAGWTNGDPNNPNNRLMNYEMRWTGGRGTVLSAHIEKWKNGIDVYRVSDTHTEYSWKPETEQVVGTTKTLDRKLAVALMRDFCRPGEYGKMHILWTALVHLPILRVFFRAPLDDELEDRTRPPYCSEATSYALRYAFTDIVRNMADHYTSPGATARSPLLHYMFTLGTPTSKEEPDHAK